MNNTPESKVTSSNESPDDEKNPSTELKESKDFPEINLIHVANVHGPSTKEIYKPSEKFTFTQIYTIAFSQFNVAKTIMANPEAIVLAENLVDDINEDPLSYSNIPYAFDEKIFKKIKGDFPEGFPKDYIDLTVAQKDWLVYCGAPIVLFSLGLLKSVYKTDTREEVTALMAYLKKKGYVNEKGEFNDDFSRAIVSDPEIKKRVQDNREERVFKLVAEAAAKSDKNNPLILLVYGIAHKIGEKIKKMENSSRIIYQGRINTERSVDSSLIFDRVRDTGLVSDDLLGAQRDSDRLLGRECERLVE